MMPAKKQTRERTRTVFVGSRRMVTNGLPRDFWRDIYYHSMTVSWPVFILGVAAAFLLTNTVFAAAFMLGSNPVANAPPGSMAHMFYFSIETLATVGYGDMHPQTHYGHIVASLEMFGGLLFAAVITGLIFARFARPKARFVFADVATLSTHDGNPTLAFRVANARLNLIGNAKAKLWLTCNEVTAEGKTFRRFHELRLAREENPIFALSWSIFHVVDSTSLLWRLVPEQLEGMDAMFILSVQGRDDSFAQEVVARRTYGWQDVRWDEDYSDIITFDEAGQITLNYHLFHETRGKALPT